VVYTRAHLGAITERVEADRDYQGFISHSILIRIGSAVAIGNSDMDMSRRVLLIDCQTSIDEDRGGDFPSSCLKEL